MACIVQSVLFLYFSDSFRNLYLTSASNHTTPASSYHDADVDIPFQHPDTTLGYQWRHILTEQEGNFSMPPYPYLVSDIRDACWLIENNDPTATINLEFQVFKLWRDQYIEVYDGPNENAPMVAWFNESVHTIVSSSNVLFVKFFAGYSRPPQILWKAFVARYFVQGMTFLLRWVLKRKKVKITYSSVIKTVKSC